MSTPEAQAERVKALALEAGFSVVRVTRADEPWEAGERLKRFVGEGRHGDMAWMESVVRGCLLGDCWPYLPALATPGIFVFACRCALCCTHRETNATGLTLQSISQ